LTISATTIHWRKKEKKKAKTGSRAENGNCLLNSRTAGLGSFMKDRRQKQVKNLGGQRSF
jgi:hypothetical protein